jgi:ankyrin repeat protein
MDVAHPNEGRTALMIAAHAGHQAAMSTLMDHVANYTLPDVFGNTLLTVIENQDNVQTRNLMARKLQETAHKHAIVAATLKNPELAQELQTMAEQAKKLQQTKNTNKCVVQ